MKSFIVLTAALLIVTMPVLAFHPTTTSCNSCHIVHNSQKDQDMPLWNGAGDNLDDFIAYDSDTLDATSAGDPSGSTLLCLSCHDYSGEKTHMNTLSGDMSKSHPIEIVYNAALVGLDDELKDPTQWNVVRSDGAGDTIANELLRGELKDTIKCVTCHDVHKQGLHVAANKSELPTGSRYTMPHLQDIDGIEFQLAYHPETEPPTFVDWSLKYGALCITCHIK